MYREEKKFIPLYLARFSVSLSLTMLLTFIAIYADLFDASGFWIGMFTTSFMLAQTITIIPIGWISDRYDKRTILLYGLGILAVSYVLFLLVQGVYSLVVARIIQGIGFSAGAVTSLALTGELAPPENRGKIIGTSNAARLLSHGLGSLAGGWMVQNWGFAPPYLLLLILTGLAALLTYKYVERDKTKISSFTFKNLFQNKNIQCISTFRASYAFAVMLVRTYVPIFARLVLSLSGTQIGIILAAEKIVNMIMQRYTGQLSDDHGRFKMLFVGGTVYAVGAFFIPFQNTFWSLVIINCFMGLADSFREPASMALFADEGKGTGIASSFSVRSLVWKPGAIIAPMLGGFLMDWQGFNYVFWAGSIFSLIGLFLMGIFLSSQKNKRENKGA